MHTPRLENRFPTEDAGLRNEKTMNNCVAVLVVFLALFVGLWSVEHRNRRTFRADRLAGVERAPKRLPDAELPAFATISNMQIAQCATEGCPLYDEVQIDSCEIVEGGPSPGRGELTVRATESRQPERYTVSSIPLPAGIPAGRYRVLDCCGEITLLEVTPEQLSVTDHDSAVAPRDFYVKIHGEQFWVFENIAVIAAAETDAALELAGLANQVPETTVYPTGECFEGSVEEGVAAQEGKRSAWHVLLNQLISEGAERFFREQWSRIESDIRRQLASLGRLPRQTWVLFMASQNGWQAAAPQLSNWLDLLSNVPGRGLPRIAVPHPFNPAL